MAVQAPPIDKRSFNEIVAQTETLLQTYSAWRPSMDGDDAGQALVRIFAHLTELVINRLNKVPGKNLLAFLDLLGASRLPPQPARVPLTFVPVAGSPVDAVVPVGTQVAAPPGEGENEPVIYETERELVVTYAQLTSLLARDPEQDKYADRSSIIAATSSMGVPIFRGDRRVEHILYIGHGELLGFRQIETLTLEANLESALQDPRELQWELWDGTTWLEKSPADGTNGLTQTGIIVFSDIEAIPPTQVNLVENRWLRCRLMTPIMASAERRAAVVRAGQLSIIKALTLRAEVARKNLPVEAAFANVVPVELSKDFFPLGEKPRLGDTLYLANSEAFSQSGADIILHVHASSRSIKATDDLELAWEFWNGEAWIELGIATPSGPQQPTPNQFQDTTKALAQTGDVSFALPEQSAATIVNGAENFWIRARIVAGNYGEEAFYDYKVPDKPEEGYKLILATFAPPSIHSVSVDYSLTRSEPPQSISTYNDFVYADVTQAKSFAPFQAINDKKATLYLGFTLPLGGTAFPNRPMSLFSGAADFQYGEITVPISPQRSQASGDPGSVVKQKFVVTNGTPTQAKFTFDTLGTLWTTEIGPQQMVLDAGQSGQVEVQITIPGDASSGSIDSGFLRLINAADPSADYTATFITVADTEIALVEQLQLRWEYWNGIDWVKLTVRDDAENFTRPGLIEFLAPPDFTSRVEFGLDRYWMRVRWESGDYRTEPGLRRVLINTTMAAQTVTLHDEVLGSSDESKNQNVSTTRAPVLPDQQLEVREPQLPSAADRIVIAAEEGEDAISSIVDATGRPQEIWVRWHEVPDFYGSAAGDRHYVLDRTTGEIRFGNGLNGRIPPLGANSLRMVRYRTGGGANGNRPAGTIVQLQTTLPYIDAVTNAEAAADGADAQSLSALLERAPRTIRHRGRAVTLEDYEDLAMLSSPEVARAKCVPLRDLIGDPRDTKPIVPGVVSVIIVPLSTETQPLPSLALISGVHDYLAANSIPTTEMLVVGPEYVRVDVTAEIALASLEGANAVEQAVYEKLAGFLHPLTGGLDGAGWAFGRAPHKSDLYALIEAVPGVDHCNALAVNSVEDQPGANDTGRFLVFSGAHKISLTFDET